MNELTLEQAIEAHLSGNFYPPLSAEWVPACKQAIQTFAVASSAALGLGEDEVFEQLNKTFVDLPGGIRVSVVEIVNELHLDSFIDALTDG